MWFEITTLLIPGKNDSPEEARAMAQWIYRELGPDVPLHFTAFHPDFKMTDLPPTPAATLSRARQIALEEGLHYVYTGNVHDRDGGTTYCPGCATPLIVRDWYRIEELSRDRGGEVPGLRDGDRGALRSVRPAAPMGPQAGAHQVGPLVLPSWLRRHLSRAKRAIGEPGSAPSRDRPFTVSP